MWGRMEGYPLGPAGWQPASCAGRRGTLWVARSLPSCSTIEHFLAVMVLDCGCTSPGWQYRHVSAVKGRQRVRGDLSERQYPDARLVRPVERYVCALVEFCLTILKGAIVTLDWPDKPRVRVLPLR